MESGPGDFAVGDGGIMPGHWPYGPASESGSECVVWG